MLAVRARELADLGPAPVMDRHLERGIGWQTRDEARHDRDADSAVDMGQFEVGDHMAGNLELPEGYLGVTASGKENNVPVVVAHRLGLAVGETGGAGPG